MGQSVSQPQRAADAEVLLERANRVMALRRGEPFDPAAASRMELELACLEGAERQDGSLDLDSLLTQRRRLRLLDRARRAGELERLDAPSRARCEALLELAPAYHRCVKAVLAMHSLFFGDEGGMELTEADPGRASLRQELETGRKQLREGLRKQGEQRSPHNRKERPMFRDPFDFNNDGKVDAEEEFLGFMMMERCFRDAEEEDSDALSDFDEENDLI